MVIGKGTRVALYLSFYLCISSPCIYLFGIRIGIIGEPIGGFNPINLAPFGEDHEEDEDNQR